MPRREHAYILGDVLEGLAKTKANEPRPTLAGLAARANLPHDRLVGYLGELRVRGLVTVERLPALTARGSQYLACYRAWIRVQVLYGLGPTMVDRDGVPFLQTMEGPATNESYAPLKGREPRPRF